MTAQAPDSSAMRAWVALTTSIITPPLSIWARPALMVKDGEVEVEEEVLLVVVGLVEAVGGG